MGLQDLNEDIYRRDYESGRDTNTEYDPGKARHRPDERPAFEQAKWEETAKKENFWSRAGRFFSFRWKWIVGAILALAVAALAFNVAAIREMLFSSDRVSVEISGPADVVSVESVQYVVKYRSQNVLPAKNVELVLSFPESFRMEKKEGAIQSGNTAVIPLPEIAGDGSGEWKFSGRFYGSKGSFAYIKASIRFSPSGMSSRFERESQFGVTIVSSPVVLEISAPQEAASGNDVEYVVSYRNEGELSFQNVRIRAEYPEGFRFVASEPKSAEGNSVWRIGNLLPGSSGEVRVKGVLSGSGNQAKVVRFSIGTLQGDDTILSYDQADRTTRIVASPLVITQLVNGGANVSVKPGDMLNYELEYRNNSDIGLRDVIMSIEIRTDLLDLSRLSLREGAYDPTKKMIIWKAPDIRGLDRLEPGQGGSVSFSVPVREDIGTSGVAGKDLFIETIARIDSPDVPFPNGSGKVVSSNSLDIRIRSVVDFQVFVLRNDPKIENVGPFPPKVGQESTYTLHLKTTNYLNDLSAAKVTMTLPTAVRYTGKSFPETETLSYNERTGQLVWDIGNLWGGGKNTKELIFQVGITPGQNEIGKTLLLLADAVFEAKDSFTGDPIVRNVEDRTTALLEDTSVDSGSYQVVP